MQSTSTNREGPVRRLGNYELLELVGHGAQAKVWKARCVAYSVPGVPYGTIVALKRFFSTGDDAEVDRRFTERTDALLELADRNIVAHLDRFTEWAAWEPARCIVMEWLDGETLQKRIGRHGEQTQTIADTDDWKEIKSVFEQCLMGLLHASERGIVHRDIKPSNIFICGNNVAKLIDFGIARHQDTTNTSTSSVGLKGTYDYMAPEFAMESGFPGNEASDVFSLGACLYEALTGEIPYPPSVTSEFNYIDRWRNQHPATPRFNHPIFTVVNDQLRHAVQKSLQPDPQARYQDYAEMLADMKKTRPRRIAGEKGEYELRRYLAKGGFGQVFKASRVQDDLTVAIKRLSSNQQIDERRFRREAGILRDFPDPHIVQYVDFVETGETDNKNFFLILKFLEGVPEWTLHGRIVSQWEKTHTGLQPKEVLEMFYHYLEALQFLHHKGVFHRDIKPANLYAPEGAPARAQIFDLGIAKNSSGSATGGPIPGTWDYMAPEVLLGRHRGTGRSDVYSLGLCLYEALAGKSAFPRLPTNPTLCYDEIIRRDRDPAARAIDCGLPVFQELPSLKDLVERSIAWKEKERFSSAREMMAHVRAILDDMSPQTRAGDPMGVSEPSTDNETIPPVPLRAATKRRSASVSSFRASSPAESARAFHHTTRQPVRIAKRTWRLSWLLTYAAMGLTVGLALFAASVFLITTPQKEESKLPTAECTANYVHGLRRACDRAEKYARTGLLAELNRAVTGLDTDSWANWMQYRVRELANMNALAFSNEFERAIGRSDVRTASTLKEEWSRASNDFCCLVDQSTYHNLLDWMRLGIEDHDLKSAAQRFDQTSKDLAKTIAAVDTNSLAGSDLAAVKYRGFTTNVWHGVDADTRAATIQGFSDSLVQLTTNYMAGHVEKAVQDYKKATNTTCAAWREADKLYAELGDMPPTLLAVVPGAEDMHRRLLDYVRDVSTARANWFAFHETRREIDRLIGQITPMTAQRLEEAEYAARKYREFAAKTWPGIDSDALATATRGFSNSLVQLTTNYMAGHANKAVRNYDTASTTNSEVWMEADKLQNELRAMASGCPVLLAVLPDADLHRGLVDHVQAIAAARAERIRGDVDWTESAEGLHADAESDREPDVLAERYDRLAVRCPANDAANMRKLEQIRSAICVKYTSNAETNCDSAVACYEKFAFSDGDSRFAALTNLAGRIGSPFRDEAGLRQFVDAVSKAKTQAQGKVKETCDELAAARNGVDPAAAGARLAQIRQRKDNPGLWDVPEVTGDWKTAWSVVLTDAEKILADRRPEGRDARVVKVKRFVDSDWFPTACPDGVAASNLVGLLGKEMEVFILGIRNATDTRLHVSVFPTNIAAQLSGTLPAGAATCLVCNVSRDSTVEATLAWHPIGANGEMIPGYERVKRTLSMKGGAGADRRIEELSVESISVTFSPSDARDPQIGALSIRKGNAAWQEARADDTLKLDVGAYALRIARPDYLPIETNFSLQIGQLDVRIDAPSESQWDGYLTPQLQALRSFTNGLYNTNSSPSRWTAIKSSYRFLTNASVRFAYPGHQERCAAAIRKYSDIVNGCLQTAEGMIEAYKQHLYQVSNPEYTGTETASYRRDAANNAPSLAFDLSPVPDDAPGLRRIRTWQRLATSPGATRQVSLELMDLSKSQSKDEKVGNCEMESLLVADPACRPDRAADLSQRLPHLAPQVARWRAHALYDPWPGRRHNGNTVAGLGAWSCAGGQLNVYDLNLALYAAYYTWIHLGDCVTPGGLADAARVKDAVEKILRDKNIPSEAVTACVSFLGAHAASAAARGGADSDWRDRNPALCILSLAANLGNATLTDAANQWLKENQKTLEKEQDCVTTFFNAITNLNLYNPPRKP